MSVRIFECRNYENCGESVTASEEYCTECAAESESRDKAFFRAVARADRLKSINGEALALLRAGCVDLAIKDLERGQSV